MREHKLQLISSIFSPLTLIQSSLHQTMKKQTTIFILDVKIIAYNN